MPSSIPIQRKYLDATKLRYRFIFALALIPALYFLPYAALIFGTDVYVKEGALKLILLVLSLWTFWASVYRYSTFEEALASGMRFMVINWICAGVLMVLAGGLSIRVL